MASRAGDLGVLQQLAEDVAARLGLLALDGRPEEGQHVVAQVVAGVHREIGHRARDLGYIDISHRNRLLIASSSDRSP